MKNIAPRLAAAAAAILLVSPSAAQQDSAKPAPGPMSGPSQPGAGMTGEMHGPGMPGHSPQGPGQGPGQGSGQSQPPPPSDEREAIRLTPGERDFVLNEMRNFLQNVQGVVSALAEDKPADVAKEARASGMGHRGHVPRSLMMKLPQQWRMLGMDTHGRFDALALEADGLADRKQMMSQLAAILANCNGCHAAYRLVAE